MKKNNIIFFGTPNFSIPFLKTLYQNSNYNIVCVVTEPDKKSGRNQQITFSPVKKFALKHNIKIYQPKKVIELKTIYKKEKVDLNIVVAYGQIIPSVILDSPKYKSINVHPSLLPKYRGPSPIQSALLNGDSNTACSIMLMDSKMDHGPILKQLIINIDINDDYSKLEKKILDVSPNFLIKTLNSYLSNKIIPLKQDDNSATITKLINKTDGLIDWTMPSRKIHNFIRAYSSWPKAYTFLNKKRLIILKSSNKNNKLIIEKVQLEGKKPMDWNEFLKGYKHKLPLALTNHLI